MYSARKLMQDFAPNMVKMQHFERYRTPRVIKTGHHTLADNFAKM